MGSHVWSGGCQVPEGVEGVGGVHGVEGEVEGEDLEGEDPSS